MYQIFPFEVGNITINHAQDLINLFSNIWIFQISLCIYWLYKIGHVLPKPNLKSNFILKQFYFYMFSLITFYMMEVFGTQILYFNFEKIMHHFLALLLFLLTYLESDLISVAYVAPFWMHAFHALLPQSLFKEIILYTYGVFLFLAIVIVIFFCYNRKVKICSVKPVLAAVLLSHTNTFSFFYGYYIRILELDVYKAVTSFVISTILTMPLYIYLFYVNSKWDLKRYVPISMKKNKVYEILDVNL